MKTLTQATSLLFAMAITTSAIAGEIIVVDGVKFATISAAISSLPPAGGMVVIPPGTYVLKPAESIVIDKPNVTLAGSGAGTIIVKAPRNPSIAWQDVIIDIKAEGARVTNLQLQGRASKFPAAQETGIHIVFPATGATVDHVLFSGTSPAEGLNAGISVDSTGGGTVTGADIHDNRLRNIIGTGDKDGLGYGILLNGDLSTVHSNTVTFSDGNGRHCIYNAVGSYNIISSNHCSGGERESIVVISFAGQTPSDYNRIENNVVKDVRINGAVGTALDNQAAISIEQYARFNHVSGNTIDNVGMHGIWVSNNDGAGAANSPEGNVIENNLISRAFNSGIMLHAANNTTVIGNVIRDANQQPTGGFDGSALDLRNSSTFLNPSGNRVISNSISDSAHKIAFSLNIGGGCVATKVTGNVFEAGHLGVISDQGTGTLFGPNIN